MWVGLSWSWGGGSVAFYLHLQWPVFQIDQVPTAVLKYNADIVHGQLASLVALLKAQNLAK